MIANSQEQYCKSLRIGDFANFFPMDGFEQDTQLVKDLCTWANKTPTEVARRAGLTPTTLLRAFRETATTRMSQPTKDKLRSAYPEFPGWRNEHPDQVGRIGPRIDPDEKPDELVYVREVDISLAMGDGTEIEDFPATSLVPFNLNFIRAVTRSKAENLLIVTGHGESMEPTLLRSDLLMMDTAQNSYTQHDQIWALVYNGGGAVKRLRRVKEDGETRYQILSDNPIVPPQTAAIEDVHILGKIVWVGRRM